MILSRPVFSRFFLSFQRRWQNLGFLSKFQIVFWTIYPIASGPITFAGLRYAGRWHSSIGGWALFMAADTVIFVLNTWLMGWLFEHPKLRNLRLRGLVLAVLLLSAASVAVQHFVIRPAIIQPIFFSVGWVPDIASPDSRLTFGLSRLYLFLVFCGWSTIYLISRSSRESEQRKRQLERSETLRRQAEVLMLRSQIDPHFLFNAMNTIVSETDGNDKLDEIVSGLSDYLRYSLANRARTHVPFGEEIDATCRYLDVQQACLGDALRVEMNIDPGSRGVPVPGVLLQPLIENAIKYGIRTSPQPLHLRIATRRSATSLRMEVSNSGSWVLPSAGPLQTSGGVGLSNVKARLELFYPGLHEFSCSAETGRVTVEIAIHDLGEQGASLPQPASPRIEGMISDRSFG